MCCGGVMIFFGMVKIFKWWKACMAIAKRLMSDFEALAKRLRSDFKA
jgi:hypothetical protein